MRFCLVFQPRKELLMLYFGTLSFLYDLLD